MTGHAYATSARTAGRMGPFAGYAENDEPMLNVLRMHRAEAANIDEELVPPELLLSAAQESWDEAVELGERHGVRNSQATVLAPTGTIGLMMDCDTTGIEPDLALTKAKKLVGGGTMFIVNQTIPRAAQARILRGPGRRHRRLHRRAQVDHRCPRFNPEHLPVFACSMGDNTIHYMGHVTMMGAVQPFISGAISKTVNMPEEATVEDVEQLHIEAWRLGLKAVALYRDNCKVGQPLSTQKKAPTSRSRSKAARSSSPRADRGARRRARHRAGAGAPEAAAQRSVEDVLVPGRRLPRVRDRRRVRRRAPG